jgi:hypothetical protein
MSVIDATAQVQNALPAFGSILMLGSVDVDGLQRHSIADDKQKIANQLPRLAFIKDLDQQGANPWQAVIKVNSLRLMDWRSL